MKIRVHRPYSCLGCLGWLLAIVFIFVLLNNVDARVRIYMAHSQAKELAQQLGYTPADFLRSRVYPVNADIVVGSAVCTTKLVFVTPLDLSDIEARLLAARSETHRINPGTDYLSEIYAELPLSRNGVSGRQSGTRGTFPAIPTVSWFLSSDAPPRQPNMVELYQTKHLSAELTFGKRQINGNIAVIWSTAGRHPFWVWC